MPRIIRLPEVISLTGLSKSTLYKKVQAGTFPSQVSLGDRAVGWIASEVNDWIDGQITCSRDSGFPSLQPSREVNR